MDSIVAISIWPKSKRSLVQIKLAKKKKQIYNRFNILRARECEDNNNNNSNALKMRLFLFENVVYARVTHTCREKYSNDLK